MVLWAETSTDSVIYFYSLQQHRQPGRGPLQQLPCPAALGRFFAVRLFVNLLYREWEFLNPNPRPICGSVTHAAKIIP